MIAQADSRKWMACLYNSFLFMEAKIMKMAKKLLAVVLTGVMALSMLTGCALSDKVKAEAIEDALNSKAAQGATVNVDYKYDSKLNDEAHKIWTTAKTTTNMLGKEIPNPLPTELKAVTIGEKTYAYFILTAPKKKDAKDKLEWATEAAKFDGVVDPSSTNIDVVANATAGKVHNYAAKDTDNKKVKFGVEFVDNGKTGDQKVDYAIVVVETNKAAA